MTIPPTQATTERLISGLTAGNSRIHHSFRKTLDRASRDSSGTRREELDALAGIVGGLGGPAAADAGKTLVPTLRHLLARVL